jgi:uncharacterized protein (DUF433 family)
MSPAPAKEQRFTRETGFDTDPDRLEWLAEATGAGADETQSAFQRLVDQGLVVLREAVPGSNRRPIAVVPAAARSPIQPLEEVILDYLLRARRDPGHPYVVRIPGVCGGEPVIRGTGVAAEAVANYFYAGKGPEDVMRDYPHLTLEEILDALHFEMDRRRSSDRAPVW